MKKRYDVLSKESILRVMKYGSATCLSLLVLLIAVKNSNNKVVKTQEELSELMGRETRTVHNALKILVAQGYVIKVEAGVYKIQTSIVF